MSKIKSLGSKCPYKTRDILKQYNTHQVAISLILEENRPQKVTPTDEVIQSEVDLMLIALQYTTDMLVMANGPRHRYHKSSLVLSVNKYLHAVKSALFRMVPARVFSKLNDKQLRIHLGLLGVLKEVITFTQQ